MTTTTTTKREVRFNTQYLSDISLEDAQLKAKILETEVRLGWCFEDEFDCMTLTESDTDLTEAGVTFAGFQTTYLTIRTQSTKPMMEFIREGLNKDRLIVFPCIPIFLPYDSVKHSAIRFDNQAVVCLYDKHYRDTEKTSYNKDAKPGKSILKTSPTFTKREPVEKLNIRASLSSTLSKTAKKYAKKAKDLTIGPIIADRKATKQRCKAMLSDALIHSTHFGFEFND